jgi:hypothetical protein
VSYEKDGVSLSLLQRAYRRSQLLSHLELSPADLDSKYLVEYPAYGFAVRRIASENTKSAVPDAANWPTSRTQRSKQKVLSDQVMERPSCKLLCTADGATPNHLRKTRLKCEELEKPQENATSVIVLSPCISSSWRQCISRARQMYSLTVVPRSLNSMCR